MRVWIVIPARGGSKSIPRKNLAPLGGKLLIDYPLAAAHAWGSAEKVIVNTDDGGIADYVKRPGVIIYDRPAWLGGDDVPVWDVLREMLDGEKLPDAVVLLQPTSPFVVPEHIQALVNLLEHPEAASAQTVIPCPHNHHEINQRHVVGKLLGSPVIDFVHPEERTVQPNKQSKMPRLLFGNTLAFKPSQALKQKTPFPNPSVMKTIDFAYGHDVDTSFDLKLARLYLSGGVVTLEHIV